MKYTSYTSKRYINKKYICLIVEIKIGGDYTQEIHAHR